MFIIMMVSTVYLLFLKQAVWQSAKIWIEEDLKGKTPVNDEFPCTEDVMYSSKTFCYEVYDTDTIVEEDGDDTFYDCCYSSDFYYTN